MTAIDQNRMESALDYLATTDDAFADAKAQLARCEILAKRARHRIFITESGTVAERQAKADIHPEVGQADDDLVEAITVYERIKAKRERASVVIDVWRSLNASLRRN